MSSEDPNQPWFALQVRPRYEKTIASTLHQMGYEEFLPLYWSRRRWSDRIKDIALPLFPGYLFCRFDPTWRLPILTIPGVILVVGVARTPVAIDDAEIAALQAIVNTGLDSRPWSYLRVGRRVRIEEGPLSGLQGILVDCKKSQRLVVSVSLLQRSVAVEIDSHWVIAAD